MSKADDPERLLAEALRAQAGSAGAPAMSGKPVTQPDPATIRIKPTQDLETDRFSPLDNIYGSGAEGPGFGLISGTEVGSMAGSVVSTAGTMTIETDTGPVAKANLWVIILFIVILGLLAGAVVGVLSVL